MLSFEPHLDVTLLTSTFLFRICTCRGGEIIRSLLSLTHKDATSSTMPLYFSVHSIQFRKSQVAPGAFIERMPFCIMQWCMWEKGYNTANAGLPTHDASLPNLSCFIVIKVPFCFVSLVNDAPCMHIRMGEGHY